MPITVYRILFRSASTDRVRRSDLQRESSTKTVDEEQLEKLKLEKERGPQLIQTVVPNERCDNNHGAG